MNTQLQTILERFAPNRLFIDESFNETRYSDVLKLSKGKEFLTANRSLVFCLVANEVGGLSGYLALLTVGAVPLMLSSSISPEQLQILVRAYQPAYIWLPAIRAQELRESDLVACKHGYSLLDLRFQRRALHNSLALLLGTSGSTGSPKFVRISADNLISNAQSIAQYLELGQNDIPVTTLPPSYTYGLSVIHSHILVGATIGVTAKTLFDRGFWDFFRKVKASSFSGVPYHYEMLKKLRFFKMQLPDLRTMTQAGGRMEPDLTKEFALHCHERGMRFFTMYGQAEATSRMSYLPSERAAYKAGSIGVAIPGGEFSLKDENGQVITQVDVPGQLVYKGPNVSMGYAHGYEDLAKGDERGGVLLTGDVAKRDNDGDYYIVGRMKRFIKLFGNRVNLQDVEAYLFVAGYRVACSGQDNRLEIYAPDITEVQSLEIKKCVIEFLQVAPVAVAVYGIQVLPMSEAGKIQYAELKPQVGVLLA
jgi:long-chain acyl-CoA synthetase